MYSSKKRTTRLLVFMCVSIASRGGVAEATDFGLYVMTSSGRDLSMAGIDSFDQLTDWLTTDWLTRSFIVSAQTLNP